MLDEYKRTDRMMAYRHNGPTTEELRHRLQSALIEDYDKRREERGKKRLTGIASTLAQLHDPTLELDVVAKKARIVMDESGTVINGSVSSKCNGQVAPPAPAFIRIQRPDEIVGAIAHPSKPTEIRKLIRSKMVRCRLCKSRFIEKNIYERHLRDRHPTEYLAYIIEQEEEMHQQRREEMEANRAEEIATGGFIPPAEDLEAQNFDVDVEKIPLPGELTNGKVARFDKFGALHVPRCAYKKKVSPQCPFCDKRFRNEYSLKKHFAKKHPECVEWVQCLKCFKAIPSESERASHLCEMMYICFECTPMRNLCTESRLYMHRSKFHRGAHSGFKCKVCGQKFLTPRKLRKHMKMVHVFTKTYGCHFCDDLFTSETSVTTHERIHTGIIRFECKICDYKCNRYQVMQEHNQEEHGHLCSICQSKLGEWSEMKNHTLIEHGGYLSSELGAGYIESPRVWVIYKGE